MGLAGNDLDYDFVSSLISKVVLKLQTANNINAKSKRENGV